LITKQMNQEHKVALFRGRVYFREQEGDKRRGEAGER